MAKINSSSQELQSKTIDFLRFPLTLMVVFIHTPSQDLDWQNLSDSTLFNTVVTLGHFTLTNIAVPCFFMFSGFLFFYKVTYFSKIVYFSKLKKRFFTLFIPYILWNLAPLCVSLVGAIYKGEVSDFFATVCDKGIFSIYWNYNTWGETVNPMGFVVRHYAPILSPLWFLRDLILAVILSPMVYYIVKYVKIYGIIALGLLYYFRVGIVVFDYHLQQLIIALFFFGLGSYFSINGKNLVVEFRKAKYLLSVVAPVFLVSAVYFYQTNYEVYRWLLPIYIVSGIITAVNISATLLEKGKVRVIGLLAQASFFIYVSHGVQILGRLSQVINKVIPSENQFVLVFKYLATPILCVSICVFIYWLMRKFTPKILEILTGSR